VLRRRRRGVRLRQKIRRVELWPLAKLALAFHAICGAISLGVLVLLWKLAVQANVPDRMTGFLVDIGFADTVEFTGPRLFRGATTIVLALVLHNTIVTVLLGVLYNLLSGILGGLMMSVVQDEGSGRRARRSASSDVGLERERPDRGKRARFRGTPRAKAAGDTTAPAVGDDDLDATGQMTSAQVTAQAAAKTTEQFSALDDDEDDTDWLLLLDDDQDDASPRSSGRASA
jgi:hypothetical protein